MEPKAAATKAKRYSSLDHWRGVACLMIAVHHSSLYLILNPTIQPHDAFSRFMCRIFWLLRFGVPIFFVISGYCIANVCDNLRFRPRSVQQYFLRRFRRIFPPYWAALVICLVVVIGIVLTKNSSLLVEFDKIPNPSSLTFGQWFGNLTLTESWRFHLAGNVGNYIHDSLILGQGWSMCYEEQFYAVCGLALFLAPRRFFQVMLGITLVVGLLNIGRLQSMLPNTEGFFFDGRWLTFAAGVLAYYRIAYVSGAKAKWVDAIMLATLVAASLHCYIHPGVIRREYCVGLFFAVVISYLHRWDAAIASSRVLRPLALCGVMSYSLYLIHWPLVKFISKSLYAVGICGAWPTLLVTVPVSLTAAVLASWVFHIKVERRFLNPPVAQQSSPVIAKPGDAVVSTAG